MRAIVGRIEALGLNDAVDWLEWTADVRGVMADLDVMAMPSWEEPFGLVVTECMAMERAVVAYQSGALPELVADAVEGLLVTPHDAGALAKAVVTLCRDPSRGAALGRRGRERVIREFSPQRQARSITTRYEALAGGRPIPQEVGLTSAHDLE